LAYVLTEAKKFHSLPSASLRPRKAGGIIQRLWSQRGVDSEFEGLKTRSDQGRRRWMS